MNFVNVALIALGSSSHQVDVPPSLRTVISAGTDFRNLPESLRASIDAILILDVLEHVPDPQLFLKGGAVFISEC
jgi:hypothetical protein